MVMKTLLKMFHHSPLPFGNYICDAKKIQEFVTTHKDSAWRVTNVHLYINVIPNVIQPLVRRLLCCALVG
jgi:hypothetical protein